LAVENTRVTQHTCSQSITSCESKGNEIDFQRAFLRAPIAKISSAARPKPPLRQIIEVLQQAMCAHDAEKLAISVLEIWEEGYCEGRSSKL